MDEIAHLKSVKKKLITYGIISACAFMPVIIAICIPALIPSNELHGVWFQRSGSIMVVISLISEYKLFSLNDYFDYFDTKYTVPIDVPNSYKVSHSLIIKASAFTMLLGTIIWGYGDLIFNYLNIQ